MGLNRLNGEGPPLALLVALAVGCGSTGDPANGSGTSTTGATTTGSSTNSSSGGGMGGSGGATTGSGGTGGGSGGSGGAPSAHGPAAADLVSAGEVVKSPGYKMVFTLGQSTQNQSKTTSPGYRMQGGLVGANGSLQ